jgi:hypothetical protein
MFIHYQHYIQKKAFNNDCFSLPPNELSDPTEKGHFSNLTGKSIADFLSKKIDNSIYTVNYEAAMRKKKMRIFGSRPDLIAYTKNSAIAIEAKGYTKGHGNMKDHKQQSTTGGIPVNCTVACVSYHLYSQVKCKYHDPFNDNIAFDKETFTELTKIYYSGLSEFLNEKYFQYDEIEVNGENFYAVELSENGYKSFFPEVSPFKISKHFEILDYYRPKIILPSNIMEYAKNGISDEIEPYHFESSNAENMYIDNDRVGLQIRC